MVPLFATPTHRTREYFSELARLSSRPAAFLRDARPELAIMRIVRLLGRISGDFDRRTHRLSICSICADPACGADHGITGYCGDRLLGARLGWHDGVTDEP